MKRSLRQLLSGGACVGVLIVSAGCAVSQPGKRDPQPAVVPQAKDNSSAKAQVAAPASPAQAAAPASPEQDPRYAQVTARVQRIVTGQLGVNLEQVQLTSVYGDLGADSLDTVEMALAFEEEFTSDFPCEDLVALRTVGDSVSYIYAHTQPPQNP